MSERISLQHPEYLEITGPGGAVTRGADQEWFPEGWQRMAGCGPTAAAVVFAYLARAHAALAPLCPGDVSGRREFTALMCRVWDYVTPRHHGLNKPELMQRGMEAYAGARGIALSPARLEIPAARTKRPEYAAVARFVRDSLERECPVAFLNLHNGKVKDPGLVALGHHRRPGRGAGRHPGQRQGAGDRPGPLAGDHPQAGRPGVRPGVRP